jgi:hypothetical protein
MRVSIISWETDSGIFFRRPPTWIVSVDVDCTELEAFLINRYQLHRFVIVKRKPSIVYEEIELDNGRTKSVRREIDENIYFRSFINEARWELPHPAAVKAFIEELREGFEAFGQHLVQNGSPPDQVVFHV